MKFRNFGFIATAVLGLAMTPGTSRAQDDRLTIHGSLNAAYAKSDGLPVFGINQDGTSNYRAVALQFGYKLSDKSRVVTQLLSRDFGTSPLQAAEKAIFPVWAFYEQRFDNGVTLKVGRNPLPRGIFNEVRFVGTLLPLYRVGAAVYGETLEYLDGAVVAKSFDLTKGFKLETNVFGGGSDLKAIVPSASGSSVYKVRLESLVGTQVWLTTPIPGVKIGEFLASYLNTPRASLPEANRGPRTLSSLTSVNGVWSKAFARGEFQTFTSTNKGVDSRYAAYYAQAGLTPHEKITIAGEYSSTTNRINMPQPFTSFDLNLGTETAVGVTFHQSAQVAFKLEGHKAEGYTFDTPVPTVVTTTSAPFKAYGAPRKKAYFGIASVAVSF